MFSHNMMLMILFSLWSCHGVPVIDISPLLQADADSRSRQVCLSNLVQVLRESGLFTIKNFGWSSAFMQEALEASRELFTLQDDLKAIPMSSSTMRGYISMGGESGLPNAVFEPKEGFAYGSNVSTLTTNESGQFDSDDLYRYYLSSENLWPTSLSESSKRILNDIYVECTQLSKLLTLAILEAFDMDMTLGQHMIDHEDGQDISVMRLFHYLMVSANSDRAEKTVLGSSPHRDWGLLTIILEDSVGGLEYYDKQGKSWVSVETEPNTLIVNAGDFLSLLDTEIESPIHQVISPKTSDRYSFVFFFYPTFDTLLPPMVVNEHDKDENLGFSFNTLIGNTGENNKFGTTIVKKWLGVQSTS